MRATKRNTTTGPARAVRPTRMADKRSSTAPASRAGKHAQKPSTEASKRSSDEKSVGGESSKGSAALLDAVQDLVHKQKQLLELELEEANDEKESWKKRYEALRKRTAQVDEAESVEIKPVPLSDLPHWELLKKPLDKPSLDELQKIDHFQLSAFHVRDEDMAALVRRAPRMKADPALTLSHSSISDDHARPLQELLSTKPFRLLDLSFNKLGTLAATAIGSSLKSQTSLQMLDLRGNRPMAAAPFMGERLARHLIEACVGVGEESVGLHSVCVTFNDYSPLAAEAEAKPIETQQQPRSATAVESKRAGGIRKKAGTTAIAKKSAKTSDGNPRNALGFIRTLRKEAQPAISHLAMVGARLSVDTLTYLGMYLCEGGCNNITSLDLSFAFIGLPGAEALSAALDRSPITLSLTTLKLKHNYLRGGGTTAICRPFIQRRHLLASLTHLDVSHNEINDVGGAAIARLVAHSSVLTFIDVSENGISPDVGMSILKECTQSEAVLTFKGMHTFTRPPLPESKLIQLERAMKDRRLTSCHGTQLFSAVDDVTLDPVTPQGRYAFQTIQSCPLKALVPAARLSGECLSGRKDTFVNIQAYLSRADGGHVLWRIVKRPIHVAGEVVVLQMGGSERSVGWNVQTRVFHLHSRLRIPHAWMKHLLIVPTKPTVSKSKRDIEEVKEIEESEFVGSPPSRLSLEVCVCGEGYTPLPLKTAAKAGRISCEGFGVWFDQFTNESPPPTVVSGLIYSDPRNQDNLNPAPRTPYIPPSLVHTQSVPFVQAFTPMETLLAEYERWWLSHVASLTLGYPLPSCDPMREGVFVCAPELWKCLRRFSCDRYTNQVLLDLQLRTTLTHTPAFHFIHALELVLLRYNPNTTDVRECEVGDVIAHRSILPLHSFEPHHSLGIDYGACDVHALLKVGHWVDIHIPIHAPTRLGDVYSLWIRPIGLDGSELRDGHCLIDVRECIVDDGDCLGVEMASLQPEQISTASVDHLNGMCPDAFEFCQKRSAVGFLSADSSGLDCGEKGSGVWWV